MDPRGLPDGVDQLITGDGRLYFQDSNNRTTVGDPTRRRAHASATRTHEHTHVHTRAALKTPTSLDTLRCFQNLSQAWTDPRANMSVAQIMERRRVERLEWDRQQLDKVVADAVQESQTECALKAAAERDFQHWVKDTMPAWEVRQHHIESQVCVLLINFHYISTVKCHQLVTVRISVLFAEEDPF